MSLTFHPALGSQTTIRVPEIGDAHIRFTASFPSREAFEQARSEGVRVEMWTDLSVGESNGDWHALPFVYPGAAPIKENEAGPSTLVLGPSEYKDASDEFGKDVYLDVVLPRSLSETRFSFTYRLVRAWGAIEWLGAFGRNGDLVLERSEERFTLAEGCSLEDGLLVRGEDSFENVPVARLNQDFEWACWALDHDGWTAHSLRAYASASTAVILVPRAPSSVFSSIPQPFLLSVGNSPDVAVSIIDGEVFVRKASAVFVHDVCYAAIQTALSSLSSVSLMVKDDGYVVLSSQRHNAELSPASVSIIPTACTATQQKTWLTHRDLSCLHPSLCNSEIVLVDLSHPAFVTLSPSSENSLVEVGPYGGQFVVAPLHVLEEAEEEVSWKLALLSSSSSAHVQVDVARVLPTPPPSPPVVSISLVSSVPSPINPSQPPSPPSVAPLSMPSFGEIGKQLDEPPMTPVSPPAKSQPELSEKPEIELEHGVDEEKENHGEDEPQRPLVVSPPQRVRGSLFRFLFTWLLRTILARVWGLLGPAARSWGLPWIFPKEQHEMAREAKIEPVPGVEENRTKRVEEVLAEEVQTDEGTEDSLHASSAELVVSSSENTLADEDAPFKTECSPAKVEDALPTEEVPVPPVDAPVYISVAPRASPKCRFLADIHSNTVSLLVRAPHVQRSLSKLNVNFGGKKILETDSTYYSTQLSENVYLINLEGPEEGARLEVALD